VLTPGHLSRRADFYHQLGQLTGAGLGILQALEHQLRAPSDPGMRDAIGRTLQQLAAGSTLGEAFRAAGSEIPQFDAALVEAAERSGRLPAVFEMLSAHYLARSQMLKQTLSGLAYPVLVLHLAAVVAGLLGVVGGGSLGGAALRFLLLVGPGYLLAGVVIYGSRAGHGEAWKASVERLLAGVPWLGAARRDLALSRLAAALESLLAAGINVLEAWDMAAKVAGSPRLQAEVAGWQTRLKAGATPAEVLAQTPAFPELFANLYRTGEVSGKLEETLGRLQALYFEQGMSRLKAFVEWLPRIIFAAAALVAGYVVVRFWLGYFQSISETLNF
jgi:type II secretory pathway component PulF